MINFRNSPFLQQQEQQQQQKVYLDCKITLNTN